MNIGKVFNQKLSDHLCNGDSSTPTDIGGIEQQEFGIQNEGHFNFPQSPPQHSIEEQHSGLENQHSTLEQYSTLKTQYSTSLKTQYSSLEAMPLS